MKVSLRFPLGVVALFGFAAAPLVVVAGQTGSDRGIEVKRIALGQVRSAEEFAKLAQSDLIYFGPVSLADRNSSKFPLAEAIKTAPAALAKIVNAPRDALIAIRGSRDSTGRLIVTSLEIDADDSFVPGSTQVFLKGPITSIDFASAIAQIDSLAVDYSGALHGVSAESIRVGTEVSFIGLQYVVNGKLFAQSAISTNDAFAMASGQTGSDLSTKGQTGSDRLTLGQTGSDRLLKGQTGSDRLTLGQTGSDRLTKGQTGSDRLLKGQTGSDRLTLGQTGSDRLTKGQTGSDRLTLGQTGSDRLTKGQTGSDRLLKGQTGSDRLTSGQTGSDRSTKGQTGSDRLSF